MAEIHDYAYYYECCTGRAQLEIGVSDEDANSQRKLLARRDALLLNPKLPVVDPAGVSAMSGTGQADALNAFLKGVDDRMDALEQEQIQLGLSVIERLRQDDPALVDELIETL